MNSPVLSHKQIRQKFLDYFANKKHHVVASSSLIPENDPTLLFANAGMNQFKNAFLGLENRGYTRAVSAQKCVRAGGKHNDLENVGFTARHHTFFEMMGNFSFGDYFKKDAIHFAWDFLTNELKIPKEKLYVTVFETDDEAADIWHQQEGVPRERIFRFGEKDNFWRMGDTGPCGPCTEIFYDHGPKAGRISDPYQGIAAGEDRFVEIWNLVFMQYFEKSPGVMEPLPKPSVDTGSGLERVVAAIQGKMNNYDTDLFMPMIQKACEMVGWNIHELLQFEMLFREQRDADTISGKSRKEITEKLAALRVLADHTRSSSFLIADGALPSNEGRGYVLRRILRRAIRYGKKLSESQSFLPVLSEVLISSMSEIYPELMARKEIILNTLRDEEARFTQTLEQGTQILNQELARMKSSKQKTLPGELVFKLYDTYGFPSDLTQLMAAEAGFNIDETEFEKNMQLAKEKARATWKGNKGGDQHEAHLIEVTQKIKSPTDFTGYETTYGKYQILSLTNGEAILAKLSAGETGYLFSDKTPFYAEGGGQVGDIGVVTQNSGKAKVINTTKQNNIYVHRIEITDGLIQTGAAEFQVSSLDRRLTAANHSATHLLHAALRKILGSHVTQAGSLVDSQKLRFDFTHNKALTENEIAQIESLVNEQISLALPVQSNVTSHKEAIASGALALFGEKYGDQVRVLKMGNFSTELCGGTHVSNTSQIRLFTLTSEGGVSAGVRRIEALTSDNALQYLQEARASFLQTSQFFGISTATPKILAGETQLQLLETIKKLQDEKKTLEKEIKKIQGGSVDVEKLVEGAKKFQVEAETARFVFADLMLDDRDVLSTLTDQLKNKIQTGVVVVVGKGEGTNPIIVSVSKNLNPKISAGSLLKEISAVMGGKGGGRPDFAQGSAPDRSKITEAQATANKILGLS